MEMLGEVNINPLPPFGNENYCAEEGEEGDEGDEGDEEEDDGVVEVTADGNRKKRRANNYTEVEDATLCRVWASVGMDAVSILSIAPTDPSKVVGTRSNRRVAGGQQQWTKWCPILLAAQLSTNM
jgi:hypothetical protein